MEGKVRREPRGDRICLPTDFLNTSPLCHPATSYDLFFSAFVGAGTCPRFCSIFGGKRLGILDPSKNRFQNRVRSALDTLVEGLMIMDSQGRIIFANSAFENIIGMDTKDLIGRHASEFSWLDESGMGA